MTLLCRYNDISPLENHHCSIAFRLLEYPECNLLENITKDMYRYDLTFSHVRATSLAHKIFSLSFSREIREGIIRCILATDMARHNEILTQFREITSIFDYNNASHKNLVSNEKISSLSFLPPYFLAHAMPCQ
jgi:high affinity cGMP-specific 3',5'-cyclic phosphodiesterase 9